MLRRAAIVTQADLARPIRAMNQEGYAELARRLTEMGFTETEGSITVKISRGGFPAWFMMAAMKAIGGREVRID